MATTTRGKVIEAIRQALIGAAALKLTPERVKARALTGLDLTTRQTLAAVAFVSERGKRIDDSGGLPASRRTMEIVVGVALPIDPAAGSQAGTVAGLDSATEQTSQVYDLVHAQVEQSLVLGKLGGLIKKCDEVDGSLAVETAVLNDIPVASSAAAHWVIEYDRKLGV